MSHRLHRSATMALALAVCTTASPAQTVAPSTAATESAMQLPPDQTAFQAANATLDHSDRLAALQAFLQSYPKSRQTTRARTIVLDLLLEQEPRNAHRIHQIAQAIVDAAAPSDRTDTEAEVASTLAEAPAGGADLHAAEAWARDAVKSATFEKLAGQIRQNLAAAKMTISEEQLQKYWSEEQTFVLSALADVYFHEGKLPQTLDTLQKVRAADLDHQAGAYLLGQTLHAQGHDAQALDALEQAEANGESTPDTQALTDKLYREQHRGTLDGLEAEIDRRNAALYQPFTPPSRVASTPGHTVLMELYTGSECEPCIAADLAMDAVLRNYSRTEVVALSLDMHNPGPDPLATPATLARAAFEGVLYTPTFHIDGQHRPTDAFGHRDRTAESYASVVAELDKQLRVASGASLQLTAARTSSGDVSTTASVHVTDADALRKFLTLAATSSSAKPAGPDTSNSPASPPAGPSPAPETPRLVLDFALVQQDIRYIGGNGIRLHPMVVRVLARPTAAAFPVTETSDTTASFTFDPAEIDASLTKYAADFQKNNEKFGTAHFRKADTALRLNNLAVAAWVEDLASHRIVAAAFAPLTDSTQERAAQ